MKKKKVNVTYVGSPSYLAYCERCEWCYENHRDHREGQRLMRKHVADTGHTVNLEKTVVISYEPLEEITAEDESPFFQEEHF